METSLVLDGFYWPRIGPSKVSRDDTLVQSKVSREDTLAQSKVSREDTLVLALSFRFAPIQNALVQVDKCNLLPGGSPCGRNKKSERRKLHSNTMHALGNFYVFQIFRKSFLPTGGESDFREFVFARGPKTFRENLSTIDWPRAINIDVPGV